MIYFSGFNLSRAILGVVFVFVTTADDAVWLVPVLRDHNNRLIHAIAFILTLQVACLISWLICVAFTFGLLSFSPYVKTNYERTIQLIAIIITWTIALYFFVKKMWKTWKKRNHHYQTLNTANVNINVADNSHYDAIPRVESPVVMLTGNENETKFSQIYFVITMTLLGALDEIACFPSLMMGGTFTIQELSFGCLVASILVLFVVFFLLKTCKCILDTMDSIPLFVIVAFIACIQTVEYFTT